MPTLALPPQSLPAFVAHVDELSEHASRGSGHEANRLAAIVDEALAHWSGTAQGLVAPIEFEDDPSYESLLPRKSFVVNVRYRFIGKLQPRRFEIDD